MRNQLTQSRAKQLRAQMTDAERRIWYHLRQRSLQGFKFRRQVPIGPYIADFACLTVPLVIELDGDQHAVRWRKDRIRDEFIRARGFRVLRFTNRDALVSTEEVLEIILKALREAPDAPGDRGRERKRGDRRYDQMASRFFPNACRASSTDNSASPASFAIATSRRTASPCFAVDSFNL